MTAIFYKAVLFIAHLLLFLKILFGQILVWFLDNIKLKSSSVFLLQDHTKLNRTPIHLGLVVTEDDISPTDISQMIVWCYILNIFQVSVYDMKGEYYSKSRH